MTIWLLSPFSPLPEPGAHESRTAALARHLADAGHHVVWFSMDWDHRRKRPVGGRRPGAPLAAGAAFGQARVATEASGPSAVSGGQVAVGGEPSAVDGMWSGEDDGTTSYQPPTTSNQPPNPRSGTPLRGTANSQQPTAHRPPPTIHLIPAPPYHHNISLRRFLSHRVWGNRLVRTARRLVADGELSPPDLILASSPPLDAPRAAFRLRKRFGCRVKLDLTDLWPHSFSHAISHLPSPISRFLLFPLFPHAHHHWKKAQGVSAMSREYLDEVKRVAPGQDTHLCYIGGEIRGQKAVGGEPSAVGRQTAKPADRDPASRDRQPPTANRPPPTEFLYLGALTDSYDFDTLFAAARILAEEGRAFHIHIAGSGPLESRLKLDTRHATLDTRHSTRDTRHSTLDTRHSTLDTRHSTLDTHFTFHGFLDAPGMHALCAHCHFGLNIIRPGLHITMPHKLNDYLCAGLPVVNSLRGEAETLLDRYQAGITYQAGDTHSLADAMRRFIESGDEGFTAGVCGTTGASETKNAPQSGALKLAAELLDREKTYPEWAEWLVS